MNDLARLNWAHVGRVEAHDGNGVARERGKFDLVARIRVHEDDSANISSGKTLLG
ncbi:MAG TPA: hypothetical protein VFB31_10090 [Pseudolabrys sp.]|nr:hypothetical protein [Pseudolabrys sp.]